MKINWCHKAELTTYLRSLKLIDQGTYLSYLTQIYGVTGSHIRRGEKIDKICEAELKNPKIIFCQYSRH